MEKLRRLHPSQESEKTRPGSSMPVCIVVFRIQTEFLIPWISTKSFSTLLLTQALTALLLLLLPSRHSACRGPVGSVSDSDGVHTDVYDGNSDEIVSEEDRNPACTSRSGAHGKKQSMMP